MAENLLNQPLDQPNSRSLERDAERLHDHQGVNPGEIAIGVILGRTSEFFDFFVYAIAAVLIFPSRIFPFASPNLAMAYSFAVFALAFVGRPLGTLVFTYIDHNYGKGVKLTSALFLLGGSTIAIALMPAYETAGTLSVALLCCFRFAQGVALGGAWDGMPSLLTLNAPERRRGWYAMIPQLGAPIGLIVACALFAYFAAILTKDDLLDWGWRYPFFVALAINVVALFARLRLVATPEFQRLFETRELQPSPPFQALKEEWRTILLGSFAPLASFALFHLVTVFPLSWVTLTTDENPVRFLLTEALGAGLCILAVVASGILADRFGRRTILATSAVAIGAFSGFAPQLLSAGPGGETAYLLMGFVLLGLAFGQSSGIVNSRFSQIHRYTGAAIVANSAWFFGAGFAPLVALHLSSHFGLWSIGLYLLSGVAGTLGALYANSELGSHLSTQAG
ncbi:MFS transporter [Qipengyuania sp. GH25]|uniref:MFS transporter n=1 Tax=Qipengyuania pacifica TaxID=2860199 RepID=A0ABS7JK98_9SPHN|nr:MFS transporter [Qipengyuania aerophila]MBX7489808.1 MFS transporter [Qipengyuania aerophila]